MPTYTYRCTKCGHTFERVQAMSDPPVKRCPECKSKVLRTFHPVGIVLKGSGFYKTDYRSKPAKSESSESSSSEKSTSKASGEAKDKSSEKKADPGKKTTAT